MELKTVTYRLLESEEGPTKLWGFHARNDAMYVVWGDYHPEKSAFPLQYRRLRVSIDSLTREMAFLMEEKLAEGYRQPDPKPTLYVDQGFNAGHDAKALYGQCNPPAAPKSLPVTDDSVAVGQGGFW